MKPILLIAALIWPGAVGAQDLVGDMRKLVAAIPAAAVDAPPVSIEIVKALNAPGSIDKLAPLAAQVVVPDGQYRWRRARQITAEMLGKLYTPDQLAAISVNLAYYGRDCTSLSAASTGLLGLPASETDVRQILTLITLAEAPAYYVRAADRLAAAFTLNVGKLAESGYLGPMKAIELSAQGPVIIGENAACEK